MDFRRKHIKPKIKRLKREKNVFQRPLFWVFILILIIVFVALYFSLFYSKFQVSRIDILGNKKVESRDIENFILNEINKKILNLEFFDFSTKSIFIVNSKDLAQNILTKFPLIELVKLQKKMPSRIILEIKEREPFAYFCHDSDKCFFLDKNGVIFEELKSFPKDMIFIKKDLDDQLFLGQNIVEKKDIDKIYEISENLKNNFQLDIKEVFISKDILVFKTSEGWQIHFDSTLDIKLQIEKMNVLLKEEIPIKTRKNLQYIYLQYGDKAYYK